MAIDIFLHSLANDIGDKAIAIILSGTGTDGTKGITEIKRAGGLVFVQDPGTAKFDGMPYSAISSGNIDYILSPESIADELMQQHKKAPAAVIVDSLPPEDEPLLTEILSLIRSKTACDFSLYKRPTIIRRLTRRMAFNNYTLADYLELLRQDEDEIQQLSKEFLVGVTRFFRDDGAFEERCWITMKENPVSCGSWSKKLMDRFHPSCRSSDAHNTILGILCGIMIFFSAL